MFYVNHRWLGGMLTNFQTIKRSIDRLNKLEAMKNEEIYNLLPKEGDSGIGEREKPAGENPGRDQEHGSTSGRHLCRGPQEGEELR